MRTVVGLVLILSLAAGEAAGQAARQPWQLPEGTTRQQLMRRHSASDYWYEQYLVADQMMTRLSRRGQLDPTDLQRTVALLRLAIDQKPRSSLSERHPVERTDFEYVPYYLLALAFSELGDAESARLCLEKENRSIVTRSSHQEGYERLAGQIRRAAESSRYAALANRVQSWPDQLWLSPAGSETAREILQLARTLNSAAPGDEASFRRDSDRLAEAVAELARVEGGRLAGRVEQLRAASWEPAFSAEPLSVDLTPCRAQASERTPEGLDQSLGTLETCRGEAETAMRQAGRLACAELDRRRSEIDRKLRFERERWPEGVPAGEGSPELPEACSAPSAWTNLDFAGLWAALDQIAFQDEMQALDNRTAQVDARIAQRTEGLNAELRSQRGRIFVASAGCARDLQLGAANDTLIRLRGRIDGALQADGTAPADQLGNVGSEIDGALDALRVRVRRGAENLIRQGEQFQGDEAASFATLPGARDAFEQDSSRATLDTVCRAAASARQTIIAWGRRNIPDLERKVGSYRWLLEAAGRWRADGESPQLACIGESLDAMPGPPPGGGANADTWVPRANDAIDRAQACVGDYRELRESWLGQLRHNLAWAEGSLAGLGASGTADGTRAGEMRLRIADQKISVERLSPLLDLSDDVTESALRETLGELELTAPEARWTELGQFQGDEAVQALLVIRDETADATLFAAAHELERWSPQIAKLVSFHALDLAYTALARGDLDRAILSLRRFGSTPSSDVPGGRAEALRHASLSYFLYTKWLLLAEADRSGEVGTFLFDDARREAERAHGAQTGFALPTTLGRSERFQEFFDDCKPM